MKWKFTFESFPGIWLTIFKENCRRRLFEELTENAEIILHTQPNWILISKYAKWNT